MLLDMFRDRVSTSILFFPGGECCLMNDSHIFSTTQQFIGTVTSLCVYRRLHVKAKIVVSAAGALHTPALLLRSGLRHKGLVGASLTLHPVLGVGGVFPHEEVRNAYCVPLFGSSVEMCLL